MLVITGGHEWRKAKDVRDDDDDEDDDDSDGNDLWGAQVLYTHTPVEYVFRLASKNHACKFFLMKQAYWHGLWHNLMSV